jgi:hypothetical protein
MSRVLRPLLPVVLAALACATTPREPGAPSAEERELVEAAEHWCEAAGYPGGEPTRPFYTDGCSMWPDGDLYRCCVEHDVAYWCGGSREDRLAADRRFRACAEVADRGQSEWVYLGVRAGGGAWMPAPWRWGYGHVYGTGYVDRCEEPRGPESPNDDESR